MLLKEIIALHCPKNVYIIEDKEGVFVSKMSERIVHLNRVAFT